MIIIGRRGAAGLAPENTLAACQAAIEADVDMIHLDIRLTKDKVPILLHDASLKRTHGVDKSISSLTLEQLRQATADQPIPTLEEILAKYLGKVLLCLELRGRGSARVVTDMIAGHPKRPASKWDLILIASFRASDLITARKAAPQANLALLHDNNPFAYIAYHRSLNLTAVGFHRLHTNRLAHEIAKKAGIFTYTYTINRPQAAFLMAKNGYDGIMTNYPDRITSQVAAKNNHKT